VLLRQHSSDHPVKSISLDLGQESGVVVYKQRCCSQELLKLWKRCLAVISKSEDCVLAGELVQRLSNTTVIFDKPPIDVTNLDLALGLQGLRHVMPGAQLCI
jgi:hypothetical protein